jgi:2-haloacid dehalogenase
VPSPERAIDAVVLDVGGVILDWSPRYLFDDLIPDATDREFFFTTVCPPAWNNAQDAGRSWADAIAEAVARHPDQAEHIRAYDEHWLRTVAGLIDGTVEIMAELRAAGIPVYALTNFSAEKWPLAVAEWEPLQWFDGAVVSGSERVVKPGPEIFRLLLDRFGLTPERTFFTDDTAVNVDGARAVGIVAELFTDPAVLRDQLTDLGVLPGD